MISTRVLLLLFFLSGINAQIALPTFQGVHKPHNTSSSNSNLEDIFGSATEFTLMGSNSGQIMVQLQVGAISVVIIVFSLVI